MITVAEHINQARDHLYKGWTKGAYNPEDGSVCGVAAIERVAMENLLNGGIQTCEPAKQKVLKKLQEIFSDENTCNIPAFNDRLDTTKEDMLNAFDKAAIEAEERGE